MKSSKNHADATRASQRRTRLISAFFFFFPGSNRTKPPPTSTKPPRTASARPSTPSRTWKPTCPWPCSSSKASSPWRAPTTWPWPGRIWISKSNPTPEGRRVAITKCPGLILELLLLVEALQNLWCKAEAANEASWGIPRPAAACPEGVNPKILPQKAVKHPKKHAGSCVHACWLPPNRRPPQFSTSTSALSQTPGEFAQFLTI